MNMEQLEVFVHCAKFNSVNQAAKALFISQPTATARLQALESNLGKPLFDRQPRQIVLNETGQQFLIYAQQILRIYEEGKKHVLDSHYNKPLKIGANLLAAHYIVPTMLQDMKLQHELTVQSNRNKEIEASLRDDAIDAAIVFASSDATWQQQLIAVNPLHLVVHPSHRLATMESVTVADVATEPFVLYEFGGFSQSVLERLFEREQQAFEAKYVVDHYEVAKSFVKNKMAIGFLPMLAMKDELAKGELHIVTLQQLPFLTEPLYLTTKKRAVRHPQLEAFAKQLIRVT